MERPYFSIYDTQHPLAGSDMQHPFDEKEADPSKPQEATPGDSLYEEEDNGGPKEV